MTQEKRGREPIRLTDFCFVYRAQHRVAEAIAASAAGRSTFAVIRKQQ